MNIPNGVIVEKIGTWTWVSGPRECMSESFRNELKAAGFRFSGKKKAWYLIPGDPADGQARRRKVRGKYSTIDEVREVWGSIQYVG